MNHLFNYNTEKINMEKEKKSPPKRGNVLQFSDYNLFDFKVVFVLVDCK